MLRRLTPEEIEAASRALVTARASTLGVEITTPVIYPNGQCVTVAVTIEGAEYVVHDAGLGSMYLTAEGVRISRELRDRLTALAARYGCDFIEGRMSRRCSADDVSVAAMLVANASRSIGDQAAEIRRQSESQFRYAVTERIRESVGKRLRENESFKGASDHTYRVSNVVLDEHEKQPIAFVVPLASRTSVPTLFRELFDLKAAFPSVVNDTVYDEMSDFRPKEDGWVLSQVGEVTAFGSLPIMLSSLMKSRAAHAS
jgi:hypothetical protein